MLVYFIYWIDYFHSLLLHYYYFPEPGYNLIGFYIENEVSYTEITNIEMVKSFMLNNSFSNSRFNDYVNEDKGIIVEDLHDENVLTKEGVLFFVDTVFYVTDKFWEYQSIFDVSLKNLLLKPVKWF